MFKKLSLFLLFVLLALSIPASATEWIIENNSVYVNDSNVSIRVSPHTLQESGDIIVNLTSKKYTGNIDVILGFDVPNVKPVLAGLYNPTYSNITKSYTCNLPNWYNYTLAPKIFYCRNNQSIPVINNQTNETTYINSTVLVFSHSFETANLTTKTAFWNETIFTEYSDVSSAFTKLTYNYGGMNTWYLRENVPVVANQSKQLKVAVQVPIKLGTYSGKYWVAIKPSGEALATAIANGHLYVLDPWWSTSWSKKRPIYVNNTGNNTGLTWYQVNLNVTYDSDMKPDFSDIRVVNDTSGLTVPYWNESIVNNSYANIWFNATSIPASVWTNSTYYLYYGNPSAASASNGTNTFEFFDDFSGDLSKWYQTSVVWSITDGIVMSGNQGSGTPLRTLNTIPNINSTETVFRGRYWDTTADPGTRRLALMSGADSTPYYLECDTNVLIGTAANTLYWDYNDPSPVSISTTEGAWYKLKSLRYSAGTSSFGVYTDGTDTLLAEKTDTVLRGTDSYLAFGVPYMNMDVDWFYVRKYASPEPNALLGAEESLPLSVISNTICANWNTIVNVITYYNTVSVQINESVTTSCFTNSSMMTAKVNVTMSGTNIAGTTSITWLWNYVSQRIQVIIII